MSEVLQPSPSGIAEVLPALARWEFDVSQGVDELCIKVSGPGRESPRGLALARGLWSQYWQRPVSRVVLELTELMILSPQITVELVLLNRWIGKRGAVVRLCGLSPEELQSSRLYRWFDYYPDYRAAARGNWPTRRPR